MYDFTRAEANALAITCSEISLSFDDSILERYRKINGQLWDEYAQELVTKEALQQLRFDRLFEELGINCDSDSFNRQYLYQLGRGAFLIDGALDICREIHASGKRIYIVTNGILATQQSRIEHSPLRGFISDFFVSEFIGWAKPHKQYFDAVFTAIPDLIVERTLIIGDSLASDIAGGILAGIDSCWFNPHGKANTTDYAPTYEISSLYDLRRFATK